MSQRRFYVGKEFGAGLGLAFLGAVVYANSFHGAFLFDDFEQILDNEKIHSIGWPWDFWLNTRRPLFLLSLAVNYALGGKDPWGYHLFNVGVHLLAALFLFGLIVRSFSFIRREQTTGTDAVVFAFIVALLWMVHPLLTQSVTYITQRVESLMGMFYLAGLYSAVRFLVNGQGRWAALAGFCGLLSGLTKEVAVTMPVVVFLYDRCFLSRSWREAWSRHRVLYLWLCVTWLAVAILFATTNPEEGWEPTAGFFYKGCTPAVYALTQTHIVCHYLRLAFWPHPLILDYGWPAVTGVKDVVLPLITLAGLGFVLVRWGQRYRWVSFCGLAFFIILSPTSSFIPIEDMAFEQRMYLPLACLVVLITALVWEGTGLLFRKDRLRRLAAINLAFGIAVVLSLMTGGRNAMYHSPRVMWEDVVEHRPDNPRAQNNVGIHLAEEGRYQEAIFHYQRAISLRPTYAEAHNNLGVALLNLGQPEQALVQYKHALQLKPRYTAAHNNSGAALILLGRDNEALLSLQHALRLKPRYPKALHNLGYLYLKQGHKDKARAVFSEVLRLDPNHHDAKRILANLDFEERRTVLPTQGLSSVK